MQQAGCYASVLHYLKAIKAAGSTDTEAVAAKMHATLVNDFYNTDVRIDPNGCIRHQTYVWQIKTPAEFQVQVGLLQAGRDARRQGRLPAARHVRL